MSLSAVQMPVNFSFISLMESMILSCFCRIESVRTLGSWLDVARECGASLWDAAGDLPLPG